MTARRAIFCLASALLAFAGVASADPPRDRYCPGDCPQPSYSPCRYWAPRIPRLFDQCRGPWLPVIAPDRHPEVQPDFIIIRYHCPAVAPELTRIQPPTPPAESRSR